mmetsp:Transcript_15380/g.23175  ORF Transcript_15380/g.23175 Transcript_15380/m.23175 type:complete len:100 (-) Transcript_15380:1542-1841(-)
MEYKGLNIKSYLTPLHSTSVSHERVYALYGNPNLGCIHFKHPAVVPFQSNARMQSFAEFRNNESHSYCCLLLQLFRLDDIFHCAGKFLSNAECVIRNDN